MIKYIVKANIQQMPVKNYLKQYEKISSTLWRKIKKHDVFFINGSKVLPTRALVNTGDYIEFDIFIQSSVLPIKMPLDIIYEDDYFLIVNKSPNLLTHPLAFEKEQTLANAVMFYYQQTNQSFGCHPIYRLDRNTSGIVIFAKMPQFQHILANNHQQLQRYYYALVHNIPNLDKDTINAPIAKQKDSIIVHQVDPNGKKAITHYQVIAKYNDYALIKLWLETGRTHQIRVHMAYINHPLLGDDLYGGKCDLISRHALHAYKVKFIHPITKKELTFTSKLPIDMAKLL